MTFTRHAWCVLFCCPGFVFAQNPTDFASLDKTALDELKTSNTPGAVVAVVRGQEVIYAKGFGVASVETGVAVTPEMLFRLGSTTKMFTSAALVSLAEEGKITLKEPIGTYVRDLPPKIARLTVHQLLSHTAGLTDESPMHGPPEDAALGRGVRALPKDVFFTEPGVLYSYSNIGYWIAGLVLEEVSGRPYADEMRHRLFEPLGMKRTTFRPTLAMTYPFAVGHQPGAQGKPVVARPLADNASTWPAGQMFSNVGEFARFAIAFMNEGKLEGKQVLSPALIAALAAGHVDTPHTGGKYGYGLGGRDTRGLFVLGHGGSRTGYGSTLVMVPKHKVAVIVLGNRTGSGLPRTTNRALELLFPNAPKDPPASTKEIAMSEKEMADLAGTYTNNRQTLKLIVKDGKLQTEAGGVIQKMGANELRMPAAKGMLPADLTLVHAADGHTYVMRLARALKRSPP